MKTKLITSNRQEELAPEEDSSGLSRAGFLQRASLLSAALLEPTVLRAEGWTRNEFNDRSTAEDVTRGLNLTGKSILITGASSGLGLETARVLAMRGATVYAAARTIEKARAAADPLSGKLVPVACELTDFTSVEACANTVTAKARSLDAVICNAGIMANPELQTVGGLEKQFVVNYLGHVHLVQKLLPALERAQQGRIVLVSSDTAPPQGGIEFDNLDGSKSYEGWAAYGQSKLACALFAAEFTRRNRGSSVTANSLIPGTINTGLFDDLSSGMKVFLSLFGGLFVFDKNIQQGAATHSFLAAHPSVAGVSGKFFDDCNVIEAPNRYVDDALLAGRLWEQTARLIRTYQR